MALKKPTLTTISQLLSYDTPKPKGSRNCLYKKLNIEFVMPEPHHQYIFYILGLPKKYPL